MPLINVLVVLIIFAVVFWLIATYAPEPFRKIGIVVVFVFMLLWLLQMIGFLGPLNTPIGIR